jgi:hypothetical protein
MFFIKKLKKFYNWRDWNLTAKTILSVDDWIKFF